METLDNDPRILVRTGEDLFWELMEVFANEMVEQGYAKSSIQYALQLLKDFGHWLGHQRIATEQVTAECLARYLKDRRVRQGRHSRSGDQAILRRLLNLLIKQGIVAQALRPEPTPTERLELEFRRYLEQERRLAPATVFNYLAFARRFLAQNIHDGEVRFDLLKAADVVCFVQREAARLHHAKRAKLMTTSLRSFLQYLRYRGFIKADLRDSVPTVASWSMTSLPQALSSEDVKRLLSCCNRDTAIGCRNAAILLLLARLGLRAGEVVSLEIEDLDWEGGEICIRGIGTSADRLPLPREVGAALADYLCHVRPVCSSRRLFIRMRAPNVGFANSTSISCLVRRALDHAGLDPAHKGAHLLRHTVATQMLRQGASLRESGEVLRHRSQQTTMIYTKVDLDLLRPLALPWPGGTQ